MKASDLVVKCLENEGVEYIFGIPGEENLDLMDSISKSTKIKFITVRHEQGAAFIADVYGRLTKKAGVCLATLGPGATNLMTGIADANLDHAPVVAITAQANLKRAHKESHQYINITASFRPLTKWNVSIPTAEIIPEVVRKAFRIAQIEKPGATHIEIPEDVAEEEVDLKPLKKVIAPAARPNLDEIRRVAQIINASEFPIILVGNGVIRADASEELIEVAEKGNIPVANTYMSKGAIPSNHPLSISTIGLVSRDYIMSGFDKADLVITVGYDFVEYGPKRWNPKCDKKIIHIDSIRSEVDMFYSTEAELIGNIKTTLKELALFLSPIERKKIAFAKQLKNIIKQERDKKKDDNSFPMVPVRVLHDIRAALEDEDILISDVGAHKQWIARVYPAYKPNTVIISNGFASMGIAVPGAIGAKLACPERKIVAVTGDGGFLMNSQEIETARRLGLNFVIVIFNDSGYGVIHWSQMHKFNRTFGVNFTNPDFVKYAESFGAKGYRVEKASEFSSILEEALNVNNVCVIDVPVDYSESLISDNLGKPVKLLSE